MKWKTKEGIVTKGTQGRSIYSIEGIKMSFSFLFVQWIFLTVSTQSIHFELQIIKHRNFFPLKGSIAINLRPFTPVSEYSQIKISIEEKMSRNKVKLMNFIWNVYLLCFVYVWLGGDPRLNLLKCISRHQLMSDNAEMNENTKIKIVEWFVIFCSTSVVEFQLSFIHDICM